MKLSIIFAAFKTKEHTFYSNQASTFFLRSLVFDGYKDIGLLLGTLLASWMM